MKPSLKHVAVAYLLVMIGCTVAFFMQRSVVYSDHIRPGREHSKSPIVVQLKDAQSGKVTEAELSFVNDSVVTNPLRMGNEIEEHLGILLLANLATGVVLVLMAFRISQQGEPAKARGGDSAVAKSPQLA